MKGPPHSSHRDADMMEVKQADLDRGAAAQVMTRLRPEWQVLICGGEPVRPQVLEVRPRVRQAIFQAPASAISGHCWLLTLLVIGGWWQAFYEYFAPAKLSGRAIMPAYGLGR